MIVLVTGVAGQLGYDVINELSNRGITAIGTDIKSKEELINKANWNKYYQCDITDKSQVDLLINNVKPDAIIHCAAWTNVDGAEDPDNRPIVKKINVDGTDNLVKASKRIGAKFLYISTDYIFDGEGTRPWEPDDKNYAPLNYYGQTKLEGELSVSSQLDKFFIVRIAWVFGLNGNNFIKTMLKLADKGYKELRVVDDQIGTPTYTYDLARLLVDMILTDKYGYYHATNEGGYISWADFAEEIFKQANKDVKVNRVTTEEYGISIAKRPHNSRLGKSKLLDNGFKPLPNWRNALAVFLEKIIHLVGFVVLHYNASDTTTKTIKSITNYFSDSPIVIVDNASPDKSGFMLKEYYSNNALIRVLILDNNVGFAKGNNAGCSFLRKMWLCKFVVVSNNDVIVHSNFYDRISAAYLKYSFAVLGPRILLKDGKENPLVRNLKPKEEIIKSHTNHIKDYQRLISKNMLKRYFFSAEYLIRFKLSTIKQSMFSIFRKNKKNNKIEYCVNPVLHGCFLVFSPKYFEVFDNCFVPETFLYREEELLYLRCQRNGLLMFYDPLITITHLEDVSTNTLSKTPVERRINKLKNLIDSENILIRYLNDVESKMVN